MNPNDLRDKETREWLKKSLDDLESARVLAATDHAANALYHCQQSAEKSLKGYLTSHDIPFRKTHNLKELGESCALIDASLEAIATRAPILTDYSWKMRYPGDPYIVEEGELSAMLALPQVFWLKSSRGCRGNKTACPLCAPCLRLAILNSAIAGCNPSAERDYPTCMNFRAAS